MKSEGGDIYIQRGLPAPAVAQPGTQPLVLFEVVNLIDMQKPVRIYMYACEKGPENFTCLQEPEPVELQALTSNNRFELKEITSVRQILSQLPYLTTEVLYCWYRQHP